jgi:hypothetical protein
MSAEYSYVPLQTVAEDENILFLDGERACRKGFISHRNTSGVFRLKGANNTCKTIYRVTFDANIAVATGGTVGPISVALQEDGETLGNAIATVTPAAVGEFNNVSISTFVVVDNGCCKNISFENVSDGTAIDVTNANVIFDRIA